MLRIDGFDEAVLGPAFVWRSGGQFETLVYDAEKIRDILMKRDGMDSHEAREYIEYNIEGAYVGEHTPVLVWSEDEWDYDD
jgi:hypothetical protein